MANFGTYASDYLSSVLKHPQNFKSQLFPDFDPADYKLDAYVALIKQGVNLDLLANGGDNTALLPNEVSTSGTAYVRKFSYSQGTTADFVWSTTFNDGSNLSSLPQGVVAPVDKKGFSFFYNNIEIIWGTPAAVNWGIITHYAYVAFANFYSDPPSDFRSTRKVLTWGALTTSKVVNKDDIFRFPIGALQINVY